MKLRLPTQQEFDEIIADKKFRGSGTTGLAAKIESHQLDEKEMMQMAQALFLEVYTQWKDQQSIPAGITRALALQKQIDEEVERGSVLATCLKGCAHCCYLEVSITNDEAQLLASLVKAGQAIDLERLRQQAQIPTRMDGTSDWREYPADVRRCVFLSTDNLCSIYEHRPSACRKYLVNSPSEQCKDIKGTSTIVSVLAAEIAVSAAYNHDNGPDSIAKKLLPILENQDVV